MGSAITWAINRYYGIHIESPMPQNFESVAYHVPHFTQISIGQETDIESHRLKYAHWRARDDKTDGLILWGVSRGTSATFCTFAKEKYPEVRMVILEGAIDSVQEVLPNRVASICPHNYVSNKITSAITAGFSFFKKWNFMQYDPQGHSPLASVAHFPERYSCYFYYFRN